MDAELERRLSRIEAFALLAAKNVFSVDDLALYLGKSRKTIYNNLDSIPHYRNGHSVSFRRSEIEDWQCQVRCTPVSSLMKND